jgi:hypothetical protein
MAEAEKKPKRSEKMYGKGPKISDEPAGKKPDAGGGVREGGAPKPKVAAVEGEGRMTEGGNAGGDVMAGTDGIPTMHQESTERMETHHRHERERGDMMHRHEREHMQREMGHHHEKHAEMNKRHEEERRSMNTRHEREHKELGERHAGMAEEGPTGGMTEKDEGKAGTEK